MARPGRLLIYGAYGYTGRLIARLAVERGFEPILAGRRTAELEPIAEGLGLEYRAFGLHAAHHGLDGVAVVLHCAGPFSRTATPMVDACLRTGAHYLDITGEVSVFEALAARDAEARQRGVMLLPGAGFDVVPTDCLAAHLKRRQPDARRLALGFLGLGAVSHGTATTIVENLHRGGLVRRAGRLTPVPAGWRTRTIDFGRGPMKAMTVPWGDVSTAWYSTGIPDIEVYMAAPTLMRWGARLSNLARWALRRDAVVQFLKGRVDARPAGPTDDERARGRSYVWGETNDAAGRPARARLVAPEGYTFTAEAALALAHRALLGDAPPGFQTPAKAYGPDLVLQLEGVQREDLP